MIVEEKLNRFQSNFGRMPTSIALAADWTTPIDAKNIEQAGNSFSSEKAFGDGLSGIRGLGDVGTGESESSIFDTIHTLFDSASVLMWPITIYGVYSVFQAMTKSEPAQKRKVAISKARKQLKAAKDMSRWSF